jgi:purine-binding chemotaxis protein CheW
MSTILAAPSDLLMMCTFRAGTGLFGIETTRIREVLGAIAPQPVPLAPEYIDGVVPYRGDVLTTLSLRVLLGLKKRVGASCVLVLDDEENGERFGLAVDEVRGVAAAARSSLEPNPATLDPRSLSLFDGTCRTPSGLMVLLDPERLRPSRLAESGLFGRVQRGGKGGLR